MFRNTAALPWLQKPGGTMDKTTTYALLLCVLLVGGVAIVTSSAQDSTAQPGQPTRARVWIQNQGKTEAVPVTLQDVATDVPPLRVQLSGTPTVTIDSGNPVRSRVVRQRWEYRDLNIGPGEDPAIVLNAAGEDGWETTGIALVDRAGTTIVLKRPR
jgi:hypothetical protein